VQKPSRLDSMCDEVAARMGRSSISPRALLSRMSIVDDPAKMATAYQDPNYLPFYFHLGRVLDPKRVFCVGAELGLQVACLLAGCSIPESALCLQPPSERFYSPRMALSNVRSATNRHFPVSVVTASLDSKPVSGLIGKGFDLSMIVVSMSVDALMDSMNICWSSVGDDGVMVVDMLIDRKSSAVFDDFCRSHNLSSRVLKTRYGTGIVSR
jgi:hypothetical protein